MTLVSSKIFALKQLWPIHFRIFRKHFSFIIVYISLENCCRSGKVESLVKIGQLTSNKKASMILDRLLAVYLTAVEFVNMFQKV